MPADMAAQADMAAAQAATVARVHRAAAPRGALAPARRNKTGSSAA